ncbi:MAG: FeoB-associated Cys-rich membrane protein [Clostridium butyricum]|nr:FeoB-associated Cys-rich membrane protein [Clostridium butyricum]
MNGCELIMGLIDLNLSTIIVLIVIVVCAVFAFKNAFINKDGCGCGSCSGCVKNDECNFNKKKY